MYTAAESFCEARRAFLIVDVPESVGTAAEMTTFLGNVDGLRHQNAAIYFPRLRIPDPLNENRLRNVAASGTLAGVFARTDATRGVWKAPAGTDADLRGATPVVNLNDQENGGLNPLGVNVLRTFPIFGSVSWGARTLDGADQQASEWKYIPVRRTALYIEESLFQGLKWVVFEPNDEPLWAQIRLNVGAFMQNLFRQGAFQGKSPAEAYFVRCDKETTTQNDIDRGVVNILVGFAPLKPAEFVVIRSSSRSPGRSQPDLRRNDDGRVQRQRTALRSLQELQVPHQVGRPLRGRDQQGLRAQAHHRGRPPPRRGRPQQQPQVAGADGVRGHHPGARRDPRSGVRALGQQGLELRLGLGAEVSLRDFRKDITIEVYNEAGQLALAYNVFRCWVSEYQALPDLDANANAVAIQTIKLENEGWERDYAVTEPAEPTFTEPAA